MVREIHCIHHFFDNPTTIDKAMILAGTKYVGPERKCDVSHDQLAIIEKWIDNIWFLMEQISLSPFAILFLLFYNYTQE